jgi:trigger factor
MEYVQQDPMAAAQLRAPLYEDKVVDFLFDKAEVTERTVTRDELQAAIEAEEGETPALAKPAKKAPAKKAEAKDAKPAEDKPAKEAKPAKKAAAPKDEAPKAAKAEAPAKKKPEAKKD